jgi:hypothetical protein
MSLVLLTLHEKFLPVLPIRINVHCTLNSVQSVPPNRALFPTPTKTSPLSRLVNVLPCTAEMLLVVWDVRFLRHMKPQLILGVVYNETWGSLCLQ